MTEADETGRSFDRLYIDASVATPAHFHSSARVETTNGGEIVHVFDDDRADRVTYPRAVVERITTTVEHAHPGKSDPATVHLRDIPGIGDKVWFDSVTVLSDSWVRGVEGVVGKSDAWLMTDFPPERVTKIDWEYTES